MPYEDLPWNPTTPDQPVRMKNNPGRRGVTTGIVKGLAGRLHVRVRFGPNEETFKAYDQLETYSEQESIRDLLASGRFGIPSDLRQILTFEKVKGRLTNVFYSMESSNTDFYAYQFKPVLKFLDSPVGRLLIADEVGLGKTIESTYIWKELQAREDARRLLIVCPSMLRDKWANDLKNRFNLEAEVIDAKKLLEKLQSFVHNRKPQSFIYIGSFEGLRPPRNWEQEQEKTTPRAELAKLLRDNTTDVSSTSILDLVIFDEAHNLRNPETVTNELAQLLCEASEHALFLTATPIQIRSTNLFQLLKLVSPEDFFDLFNFEQMLTANRPVVEALSLIWRNSPTPDCPNPISAAKLAIEKATQSSYFSNNSRLKQVHQELEKAEKNKILEPEIQVQLAQVLESSSLFGQFMTRTRKRDVMKRVVRRAKTLNVKFSASEKEIYDQVSQKIRQKAKGQKGVAVFSLIMRQRQMASCMVAALESWKQKDLMDESSFLWEDLGLLAISKKTTDSTSSSFNWDLPAQSELNKLERDDTKYKQLIKCLKPQLKKNPEEKFVLFAYFKGTLNYLQRRLEADGISTCLIMGGMKREDKQAVLNQFKESNCSVLLSSEVGSEGIDLQFCRVLINYDLPWNPMRVEQRIGRLDRLGQKSEQIAIINFSLQDTIEERILERLYERIKIFEESIGDVEEILGERTEKLLLELLRADLTDAERQRIAEQEIVAIAHEIDQQRKLENEAINMVAFSEYILSTIETSRKQGRWLRPEELEAFVQNFFRLQFPGTVINPKQDQPHVFDISLSAEAKLDLKLYCSDNQSPVRTKLFQPSNQPTTCFFDPKIAGTVGKLTWELLDPTHPLIRWIASKYETGEQSFQPVSASQLALRQVKGLNVEPGVYVYIIHLWTFLGLRRENRLAYQVVRTSDKKSLPNEIAEKLVAKVMSEGEQRPNANNAFEDFSEVLSSYDNCDDLLQDSFLEATIAFEAENQDWCNVQENNARRFHDRKISELKARIENFRWQGKTRIIPALEGQIAKIEQNLSATLVKISQKREQIEALNPAIATGLIFIEK